MTDHPKTPDGETPMQRALRMKKAAQQAKPQPAGVDKVRPGRGSGIAAGASKPWMKK